MVASLVGRAQALGAWASVVVARGLSSCVSRALELGLSSCGTRGYLLLGMWNLLTIQHSKKLRSWHPVP